MKRNIPKQQSKIENLERKIERQNIRCCLKRKLELEHEELNLLIQSPNLSHESKLKLKDIKIELRQIEDEISKITNDSDASKYNYLMNFITIDSISD